MRFWTGAAVALAVFAAPAAHAQDYQEQLNRQVGAADGLLISRGYSRVETMRRGALNDGASETQSYELEAGRNYVLLGVCDTDCSDLDLRVEAPNGDVVAEDELEDDAPIVEFVAPMTGIFRAQVTMFSCSADPCYFASALYVR